MVSAGNAAAGSTTEAAADASFASEGLAAADAFHDVVLATGLEAAGTGPSDNGTDPVAPSEVDPALPETDDGTTARSAAEADGALATLKDDDDDTAGG